MSDFPLHSASASPAHDATSQVASAYDRWSRQYDTDRNLTRDLDAAVLRKKAGVFIEGRSVLEIGCGTGKNTEWIAERAARVLAMDFSAGMLAVAARRVPQPHVRFVSQDLRTTWPIADASVDVVIGNLVLEHIEDLTHIYAEAARVLRDGGQLYFCELHPFRQWRGSQAHFTDRLSGEIVQVSAYVHTVGEYVNQALQQTFVLRALDECLEEDAPADALPRLLSLLFTRATRL
ncbi:MAG: class I SAM-dependent methyltransferase [Gemmatimonas sp.]